MIKLSHQILYPWFNDAYLHCDSCKFRDHDKMPNYKSLRKKCQRCKPRDSKHYPTEHRRLASHHGIGPGSYEDAFRGFF